MSEQENIKPVQIFEGEYWQASTIQQLLEDNNIETFLENEYMASIAPWRIEPGGYNTVKVIISSNDYQSAIKLIDEFNGATNENNIISDPT